MEILILILAWMSGVACGVVLGLVREHFLKQPDSLPEEDADERMKWPAHFDR